MLPLLYAIYSFLPIRCPYSLLPLYDARILFLTYMAPVYSSLPRRCPYTLFPDTVPVRILFHPLFGTRKRFLPHMHGARILFLPYTMAVISSSGIWFPYTVPLLYCAMQYTVPLLFGARILFLSYTMPVYSSPPIRCPYTVPLLHGARILFPSYTMPVRILVRYSKNVSKHIVQHYCAK